MIKDDGKKSSFSAKTRFNGHVIWESKIEGAKSPAVVNAHSHVQPSHRGEGKVRKKAEATA